MAEVREVQIATHVRENIPLLNKGESLHCVIAPNGHVWGKEFGGMSGNRDVELMVLAPCEDGYLWRLYAAPWRKSGEGEDALTKEQRRKIAMIMSATDTIQAMLTTIWVESSTRLTTDFWWDNDRNERPARLRLWDNPFNVDVAECSNNEKYAVRSSRGFFDLWYDEPSFTFRVATRENVGFLQRGYQHGVGTNEWEPTPRTVLALYELDEWMRGKVLKEENRQWNVFMLGRARNGAFRINRNIPSAGIKSGSTIKILKDGWNIFETFQIDDAILLLEEKGVAENAKEAYFTLAVARHKFARELARILSNHLLPPTG